MNKSPETDTYQLPPMGNNPSSTRAGTTPGSFAATPTIHPGVEGARTYSSPDTPGMPGVSAKTAWDFLPGGWSTELKTAEEVETRIEYSAGVGQVIFKQSDQNFRGVGFPSSFQPITQLEFARV